MAESQNRLMGDLRIRLRENMVLPVLTLDDPQASVSLAQALQAAGCGVLEVTLRTDAALACLEAIATAVPSMVLGAGTVRTANDLQSAFNAGAGFAVSPGSTPELLQLQAPIPLILGVATASEAMQAGLAGHRMLKLFPAAHCGGPSLLRAFASPLADLSFVPTGGINGDSAPEYLALANVVCVGGSWLVPASLVADQDWQALEHFVVSSLAHLRARVLALPD